MSFGEQRCSMTQNASGISNTNDIPQEPTGDIWDQDEIGNVSKHPTTTQVVSPPDNTTLAGAKRPEHTDDTNEYPGAHKKQRHDGRAQSAEPLRKEDRPLPHHETSGSTSVSEKRSSHSYSNGHRSNHGSPLVTNILGTYIHILMWLFFLFHKNRFLNVGTINKNTPRGEEISRPHLGEKLERVMLCSQNLSESTSMTWRCTPRNAPPIVTV